MPFSVVTLTSPDAPEPTTARIIVEDTTANEAAGVPPKETAVAPVKFVPVMVIVESVPPLVGVKELMVGTGTTGAIYVNPTTVSFPLGVATTTYPEAPVPTTALIVEAFTTVKEAAAVPPKVTEVAPVKLLPEMVTVESVEALVGVKELMLGAGAL